MALLEVRGLEVAIRGVTILRDVSFDIEKTETLGLVGESGCGKTMLGMTLMGMLPNGGKIVNGSVHFDGTDLSNLRERQWLDIRGSQIAMVMQDPFTSLNPVLKVGDQVAESYQLHQKMSLREARKAAIQMLGRVGIPDPERSAAKFPHQMSGGQRQRVVIAIAFACQPKFLIADEPTTALDVTLQVQILKLLKELQEESGTAILIISHNVGVISAVSDRIGVFYAGQMVEHGSTKDLLSQPLHPYTRGLLGALPTISKEPLKTIPGSPPAFAALPEGCAFRPRCELAFQACTKIPQPTGLGGHEVRCWAAERDVIAASDPTTTGQSRP